MKGESRRLSALSAAVTSTLGYQRPDGDPNASQQLTARVENIPAQVRKHCKTVSTAAVAQAVSILKSHYPKINYSIVNDGYAVEDTEEVARLYAEAKSLV